MWISLEVGYYFLLNINGEKTLLGDVRKKKLKISALLKNEERGVRKSSHGKMAPTHTPSPAPAAPSQEHSQQRQTGGKCSPESLKYPKLLKKPTVPRAQVVIGSSKVWK